LCFLFLLTMSGSQNSMGQEAPDWENMTRQELHDKFAQMMSEQVHDIESRFAKAVDGVENMIDTKLDAKFTELIARLPPQPAVAPAQPPLRQRARRLCFADTQASGVGAPAAADVAAASDVGQYDDYVADSEDEVEQEAHNEQPLVRPHAYVRQRRHPPHPQVRDDEHVPKLKLNLKPFEGRYIPDAYLTWELETEQRFTCLQYPENRRVTAAVCEFTGFESIWWSEHCSLHANNIPTTWADLKDAMRTRWVPPYYQHELLQKLQRLRQGKNSVEEYYQELQTGLITCGLVEDNEAMLARFMGGLNKEIQTILEYNDYTTITRLFHLACKAEREVQDRQAATRPKFSAGRNTSWTSCGPSTYTRPAAPPSTSAAHSYREPPKQPAPPFKGAQSGPAASSSSSMASTGQARDRDIKCRRCQGGGHFAKDCPSKRVMTITADGGYESASDYDEETLVLIANEEQGAHDDAHDVEYIAPDDADKYASLVAQRVLSVQVTKAEQNQRHNLFHTKGVVKERSVRIIIDGGSCNNLASMELVEKLSLTTRPHPHPYYIQWFNNSGKIKVTRSDRVHFRIAAYADYVDCDVVHMQACSLLLGRPWQFDRNVVHHCRTTQFTLVHMDKNIALLPMSPAQILKDDLARASKAKQEKHKSENEIAAKEFEQQHKTNSKSKPAVSNEIKLTSPTLLAT